MAEGREEGWERRVFERLALEVLAEQRRRRRWSVFLRLSTLALVAAVLWVFGGFAEVEPLDGGRHTALVSLEGEIAAKGEVSADHVVASLQAAFADSGTQGVVLRINSPGGSPVQAGIISDEILRLRAQHPETQDLYREVCVLLFFRHGITPTANRLYQLVRKGSMSAPAEALAKFWATLREKSRVRIEHADLPEDLQGAAGELEEPEADPGSPGRRGEPLPDHAGAAARVAAGARRRARPG